jgi:acetolactate synthase-1/2/3 large subunit
VKDLPDALKRALETDGPALIEIDMKSIGDFAHSFAGPPNRAKTKD